jgi:plasmid stabilization system protein ParE
MNVQWSPRALADLWRILVRANADWGANVTAALEKRIHNSANLIGRNPSASIEVRNRPGVRFIPLVRYPFRIFFRIKGDNVLILHIRHTARKRE